MIIAIFILQKMHQIEISPLPHKYHVLLLKGSVCKESSRNTLETPDFFTHGSALLPVLSPSPAGEHRWGFGGQKHFMAERSALDWAGPQVTCSHGNGESEEKVGQGVGCFSWPHPLLPPLFPTLCWQCSSSPHNYKFRVDPFPLPSVNFLTCPLVFFSTNLSTSNCTQM